MSDGLSRVGEALSVVFAVSLLALVAVLFFVLWRRRFISRQTPAADDGQDLSAESRNTSAASKELLYFLCWKHHQSRVEPDGGGRGGGNPSNAVNGSSPEEPTEVIDILKLQSMRGPSRVLFTIKEEERVDVDSERSGSSSAEKSAKKKRRLSLEECFSFDGDPPEDMTVTVVGDRETTPYLSPCDSPLFYTPSASPMREWADVGSPEEGCGGVSGDETVSFSCRV